MLPAEPAAALASVPWLAGLAPADRARVLAGSCERTWRDRDVLVREGDEGASCHLVLDGVVRVLRTAPDGRRIAIARLAPPAAFGELALLGSRRRTATVEAVGACRTLEVRADDVLDVLRRDAGAALGLAQVLADRLLASDEKVVGYALGTAAGGVAATLLSWVQARQDQGAGEADVEVVGGVVDVARSAGVSRQAAERFMEHLELEGVVSLRRGRVVVHRPAALSEYLG